MEVRIALAANAAARATFRVSYTVRGARWAPLYDARLDSDTRERRPALELVRRAEIVQQTGEDWSDVALTVSTVRTAQGGSGPELQPLIVRYYQPPAMQPILRQSRVLNDAMGRVPIAGLAYKDDPMLAAAPSPQPTSAPVPAQEQETTVDTGGFQAIFRVPGRVSVAASEGAKSFRISTEQIAPELLVRAVPALDETAYLEASFKHAEEAPLLPGRASVYRDGIFVGRSAMPLTPKHETLRLGFGADEKVRVTRTVTRKIEGSAGIISSAKTDEREFKITLRSGHARPIKAVIEDQVPASETAEIQVELLPVTTPPSDVTSAAAAGCSPGASTRRRAKRRRSSSAGGCAGRGTRSSPTSRADHKLRHPWSRAGGKPSRANDLPPRTASVIDGAARSSRRRIKLRFKGSRWRMWWWSAPSGATRARAKSSIGCPNRPTWWCAFRAATTPATRLWSEASPTSSRCSPPGWCATSSPSSAMAWCSTRAR